MTDDSRMFGCDVEVGAVGPFTTEQHLDHLRDSLNLSGHKGPYKIFGVFLNGEDTIVCYTGNGPSGERNAHAIVAANETKPVASETEFEEALQRALVEAQNVLIVAERTGTSSDTAELDAAHARLENARQRVLDLWNGKR